MSALPEKSLALDNIALEQDLLGCILVTRGEAFDAAEPFLTADDFVEPVHQLLFGKFCEARRAGNSITLSLVLAALGQDAGIQLLPGKKVSEYIAELMSQAAAPTNVADYAKAIREYSDRRRIVEVTETLRAGADVSASPAELAAVGIEQLDSIASNQPGRRAQSSWLGEATPRSVERMTWGMQNPGKITGVSWGIHDLDNVTNGLQRGELIILAGRPGMGKSALALSSARQTALNGTNILFFSLEMGDISLADRALADSCYTRLDGIPYHAIARGALTDQEAQRVVLASREMASLPIRIEEQARVTVSQIAARSRRHALMLERKGQALDMVIVDHLHLIAASQRYAGNRVGEVTEISGSLKALAKELNVPVVALAQLSRGVESREDKRPMLSDLRDSGSIEQDADLIVFLYREAYYLNRMKFDTAEAEDNRAARAWEVRYALEAIVAKQRNGPTKTVNLFFDPSCNAVRDLARAA